MAYPLGSTLESGPFVPHTEHVSIRAVLDVVEDTVLLSLPVLTAVGLKLLRDTKVQKDNRAEKLKPSESQMQLGHTLNCDATAGVSCLD